MEDKKDIVKLLRLVKAIGKSNEQRKNPVSENKNPTIRSLKAALPYFEIDQQRNMAVIIKVMEINEMLSQYRRLAQGNTKYEADFNKALIMALREQVSDEQKKFIDMFVKIFEINRAMEVQNNEQK